MAQITSLQTPFVSFLANVNKNNNNNNDNVNNNTNNKMINDNNSSNNNSNSSVKSGNQTGGPTVENESKTGETTDQSKEAEKQVVKPSFKEDQNRVLMDCFRSTTTTDKIKGELLEKYNVTMTTATIMRYITLKTSNEAESLLKQSPITLCNAKIVVRWFIDRQRVPNHAHNKPRIIQELEACNAENMKNMNKNDMNSNNNTDSNNNNDAISLSIDDLQTRLFRKFRYCVDEPDLTKMVSNNPTEVQICRQGQETVLRTPIYQVPHDGTFHKLRAKVLKILTLKSRHHRRRSTAFICYTF